MPRYQSICERYGQPRSVALGYLGGMLAAMTRHHFMHTDLQYLISEGLIIGSAGVGAAIVAEAITDDFVRAAYKNSLTGGRVKRAFQFAAYAAGIALGTGLAVPYLEQKRAEAGKTSVYTPAP